MRDALSSSFAKGADSEIISIEFLPRPSWRDERQRRGQNEFYKLINDDADIAGRAHCLTHARGKLVALVLEFERANTLADRVVQVLKAAADQLSASRPSMVWLHFVGLSESEFRKLAEFSMDGKGNGLNALVARALTSRGSKDRSHVNIVRFSAEAEEITRRPALNDQLLLIRAASISGPAYDVPIPNGRFALPNSDL
jgi:hypothetical protein